MADDSMVLPVEYGASLECPFEFAEGVFDAPQLLVLRKQVTSASVAQIGDDSEESIFLLSISDLRIIELRSLALVEALKKKAIVGIGDESVVRGSGFSESRRESHIRTQTRRMKSYGSRTCGLESPSNLAMLAGNHLLVGFQGARESPPKYPGAYRQSS